MTVDDVRWPAWQPQVHGTLLFVLRDAPGGREVLLIRKLRGLGAGKINGPGGKLEPGETPLQAALRETEEEVCVRALDPTWHGTLRFQFLDGLRLQVEVFVAHGHTGTPRATDEALPLWVDVDQLPFHEMWADDRAWLPHALAGRRVDLRAVFDEDRMLDHTLVVS